MKKQVDYSRSLGYSGNYLSQYKHTRALPKDTSAEEVARFCVIEKEEQDSVINQCIAMYFDLKERRKLHAFSRYLVTVGAYNHERSFMATINRYFYNAYGLRNRNYMNEQKVILKLFKEWVNV